MSRLRPTRRPSLLALFLAGACARPGPAPEPPAPEPTPTLGAAEVTAIALALRLEDRREFDLETLAPLLADPHPEVRRRAALAVGRIGDEEGRPLLLMMLEDSVVRVRADAAFALGVLADTSAAVRDRLGQAALADDEPAAVRIEAVHALGKVGGDAARPILERILADTSAPSGVVDEALLAIWKVAGTAAAKVVAAVTPHTLSDEPERRWRAIYALMRIGDPTAVPALIRALRDDEHRVREFAARGLAPRVADAANARQTARDALLMALEDPHPHVRINAIRSLGSYGDPATAPAVLRRLSDPDPGVVATAVETLGAIGGAGTAEALAAIVRNHDARPALRGAALASLVRVEPAAAIGAAPVLATSGDWLERLYAARALAGAPWADVGPILVERARDDDARVAAAALAALDAATPDTLPRSPIFEEALAAADVGVRTAALNAVARRIDPGDLPVLLEAYARALHDGGENDAALAAVAALAALAERGVPVANTFFLRFERAEDPLVRSAVRRRLGDGGWGETFPIETGRRLEDYERVVRELIVPDLLDGRRPKVTIRTERGPIALELAATDAPLTVRNFLDLAGQGSFDGHRWHRVVHNFVIQDGDPRGDGAGGPGYAIRDEINGIRYGRGIVGMALAGPDTGGSQFFITHSPQPHLDGGYTVFGRVIDGMDVVDRILQDDRIEAIEPST